jgi:hypothetical protein
MVTQKVVSKKAKKMDTSKEMQYLKSNGKKILSLPRLTYSTHRTIPQSASFLDTNRGERPNLTAATATFLLRAINHNQGYRHKNNHTMLQLYDGIQMKPMICETKLTGLTNHLVPLGPHLFAATREADRQFIEYYLVDDKKKKIYTTHRWTPSEKTGFQGEPAIAHSSYQHFYDPEDVTLCIGGENLESFIFDVTTQQLLHTLDLGKTFGTYGPYFSGAGNNCVTIDLRQPYRCESESMLGFHPKFESHFLLPYQGRMLSCQGCTFQELPQGVLSTHQAEPTWGRVDGYHAGIFAHQYLASSHSGAMVRFLPHEKRAEKRTELVGISNGPYFGANPHVIFDAENEYWM